MRMLVVAATPAEAAALAEQAAAGAFAPHQVAVLVTGIGMVNTAYAMGRELALHSYDWLLNVGVCGAFDRGLALGAVVQIGSETYTELGAESPGGWLDLGAMGFEHFAAGGRSYGNRIHHPAPPALPYPLVHGATANTVLGTATGIAAAQARYPEPQVQSMEGAAFFQAALQAGAANFCALRAVSNYVEPRNRANWRMAEAIANATAAAADFLRSR